MTDAMPTVPEFYTDKNIFLTGGTGFLGKVLLEKVLRTCPNLRCIYCLVRPKKGQDGKTRLDNMLQEPCFDRLRSEQPQFAEKVHAIHGDITEDELGISEDNRNLLADSIHIVIHSAATIRFTEHLKLAVVMNVLAVRKVLELCRTMKLLQALVHVSTAYCNCDRDFIEERIYQPYVHHQKIIDMIQWMDDDAIEIVTPSLLKDLPNTYTFTKKLGEALLIEEGNGLPISIVRPSIVSGALREPVPGWIDNLNGPTGFYIAYGKGLIRSFKCDPSTIADMIPVDFPVNVILCAAWHTALIHCPGQTRKPPFIFHITSGGLNPFTWGEMQDVLVRHFKQYPMDQCFRRPGKKAITTSSTVHSYWLLVSHLIPAYLADAAYALLGKKPRMVSLYSKLHRAMDTLQFFTQHTWEWTHNNLDMLRMSLSPADQKIFYFDAREIHWKSYVEGYALGAKKFVMKENLESLPVARAHMRKLRNIRYVFNSFIVIAVWRLLIAKSSLARNSWHLAMALLYKFLRFFKLSSTIKT